MEHGLPSILCHTIPALYLDDCGCFSCGGQLHSTSAALKPHKLLHSKRDELRLANFIALTMSSFDSQVSDLGQVLHMVGGTAASFMIFFLPGMLLVNAAIVKHSNTVGLADSK